jgi:uncharacterized Ntn-hydrolase superfamily protein
MGVAVQSHWFSVGSMVGWGESGVGIAAIQSFQNYSFGPLSLQLMKAGKSPAEALRVLIAVDDRPDLRQIALMNFRGEVATHTGEHCIPEAGHYVGDGFSAQGNIMRNSDVWGAMASAFSSSRGRLASRLLRSLEAAEAVGGDARGRQSASILIIRQHPIGLTRNHKLMDLRVEDHPDPVTELKRLVRFHEAYEHANTGDEFMSTGATEEAVLEFEKAFDKAPEVVELKFWQAITLLDRGDQAKAVPLLKEVFASSKDWKELLRKLPRTNFYAFDDKMISEMLSSMT